MKDPQKTDVKVNSALKFAIGYLERRWPDAGNIELCTWKEYVAKEYGPYSVRESYAEFLKSRCIDFMPDDNCIWIYYDYCTDELTEDEVDLFHKDMEILWNALRIQGEPLAESDGSGNGLIYGFQLFAPMK
jgi:hypothetical protein